MARTWFLNLSRSLHGLRPNVGRGWVAGLWMLAAPALAGDRLPLDRATVEQLAALPGVGGELAARIVELRTERGAISSVEELRILPGISEAQIDTLRASTGIRIAVTTGTDKKFETADQVLAEFDREPKVEEVQAWAAEYAKVEASLVDRWLAASRGFAALPQVRVQWGLDDDWSNSFRYFNEFGTPITTNNEPSQEVMTDADRGQGQGIDIYAVWDLDKLVMSSEQIRVINEAQDIVKLREKVLGEVTRLYFERRRLQVDMLLNPKPDLAGKVRDELRLRELTANVDAYTGGRFSAQVASRR